MNPQTYPVDTLTALSSLKTVLRDSERLLGVLVRAVQHASVLRQVLDLVVHLAHLAAELRLPEGDVIPPLGQLLCVGRLTRPSLRVFLEKACQCTSSIGVSNR